jgi:hypothetical protein
MSNEEDLFQAQRMGVNVPTKTIVNVPAPFPKYPLNAEEEIDFVEHRNKKVPELIYAQDSMELQMVPTMIKMVEKDLNAKIDVKHIK